MANVNDYRPHLLASDSVSALFAKTDSGSRWPLLLPAQPNTNIVSHTLRPLSRITAPKVQCNHQLHAAPPVLHALARGSSPPLPGGKRINQVRQADAHARKPCRRERSSSSCVYIPTYARRIVPVKTCYMGVPIRTKRLSPSLRLSLAFKHTDPLSLSHLRPRRLTVRRDSRRGSTCCSGNGFKRFISPATSAPEGPLSAVSTRGRTHLYACALTYTQSHSTQSYIFIKGPLTGAGGWREGQVTGTRATSVQPNSQPTGSSETTPGTSVSTSQTASRPCLPPPALQSSNRAQTLDYLLNAI